jgi:hypothetical protein
MDDWAFIQIAKGELQVEHERPYSKPSSGQLYHYLVDPGKDFQKIGDKKGEQ